MYLLKLFYVVTCKFLFAYRGLTQDCFLHLCLLHAVLNITKHDTSAILVYAPCDADTWLWIEVFLTDICKLRKGKLLRTFLNFKLKKKCKKVQKVLLHPLSVYYNRWLHVIEFYKKRTTLKHTQHRICNGINNGEINKFRM